MYIKLALLLLGLASVSQALAASPGIFSKKGKYGLVDKVTEKVLLKAKYDTIFPFKGGKYALLRKNGKYGVVNQEGQLYLPCKYKKILFPPLTSIIGNVYFWASEDGVFFSQHSATKYYTASWRNVFYGPDKCWYGQSHTGMWMKLIGFDAVVPVYDMKDSGPEYVKLPDDYVLFNGSIYSPRPDRKKILEKVTAAKTVRIAQRRFIKAAKGDAAVILIDLSSGDIWEKSGTGLDGTYSSLSGTKNYALRVNDDNFYYVQSLVDGPSPIYVITHPEYNLKSLETSSRTILPFRLSDIRIDKNAGTYNGEALWKVTMKSQQPIFEPDIAEFVNEFGNIYPNFIVVSQSSMGKSLFGNSGKELVHYSLENVCTRYDFLIAKVDGEEIMLNMEGVSDLSQYDGFWHSTQGNLTVNDFIVSKNGKVGLYVEGQGEVIPPLYDGFRRQWGHIYAYVDGKVGLYDDYGNRIIAPAYREIRVANAYTDPSFYLWKTMSGATMIMDNKGGVVIPAGTIDEASFLSGEEGKWCKVYKNGSMGILNLQSRRIVIPCAYEDKIFFGEGRWPDKKIGVYRSTSAGELIEIWTLGGKKINSRTFPRSAKYSMKHYLENQLNVLFYYDD